MNPSNWLALATSAIALLSVVLSHRSNKNQLKITADLAIKQIEAAAADTARRLRAEILLKDRQEWIRDFRETVNDILHLADPDLYDVLPTEERVKALTRLAHKVDLLLPAGQQHVDLIGPIAHATVCVRNPLPPTPLPERYNYLQQITVVTRRILKAELERVESAM